MALLTCRDVAFAYEGNIVVSGLHFSVSAGDYLCVVGENGSGKTTLLKGLLQLKPPQRGDITAGEGLRANEIGYLPQQTAAQKDFPASAYEVVLSGCMGANGLRPFYSKTDRRTALDTMEQLGISPLRGRCYRELSGGQQQRVLLARALCATQRLLLLDEPAAGLDPVVTQEFYRTLAQINRQRGIAVVMVSHDISSAIKHASHILHLQNTQLFFGPTQDYIHSEAGKRFINQEGESADA
jgi:zinc transport system ATP-binding protein